MVRNIGARTKGGRSVLAPPGPAWAGSLMGTSIFATLAQTHGVPIVPALLMVVAIGAFVFIVVGWLSYRNPGWGSHLMAPWGMFAMGVMSVGSAATAVVGQGLWQEASWWCGAPLAFVVCLNQLRGFPGVPTFQWGLALVSPMVAATSAGQLSARGGLFADFYHWAGVVAFCLAFFTALPIFARCYLAAIYGRLDIPETLAGTAWIPLGVVGQSTAAAQVLFGGRFAVVYGFAMLAAGIAPAVFAFRRFVRAVICWAGYSPGWWGSTFPVGTLCLGAHLLSGATGYAWLDIVSVGFLALLAVHWVACVARFGWWAMVE
nr:hypothetical protein [Corynebacterium lactis]